MTGETIHNEKRDKIESAMLRNLSHFRKSNVFFVFLKIFMRIFSFVMEKYVILQPERKNTREP